MQALGKQSPCSCCIYPLLLDGRRWKVVSRLLVVLAFASVTHPNGRPPLRHLALWLAAQGDVVERKMLVYPFVLHRSDQECIAFTQKNEAMSALDGKVGNV